MMENYGNRFVQTSAHTPNQTDTGILTKYRAITLDNGWHVWRVVWDNVGFRFYQDGREYLAVASGDLQDWCFNSSVAMFMLLNMAVGGTVGTPPPSAKFPVDMLVDYVRVWQKRTGTTEAWRTAATTAGPKRPIACSPLLCPTFPRHAQRPASWN